MSRSVTTRPSVRRDAVRDDYLALVRQFPLRPIHSEREYDAAAEFLDTLVLRTDLSAGEKQYVEALSIFIEDYDRRHNIFDTSSLTPLDMLVHLMEANDMNTSDLGRLLGSKGVASEVLHGKRQLSKSHIVKLAKRFAVSPGLFLPRY